MAKQPNIITVDLSQLGKLAKRGGDIILDAEAEQALVDLLELQGRIEGAIAEAKRQIEQRALEYNPNFTSVQAKRLKIGFQMFGAKYAIDAGKLDKLPKDLYSEKISYSPNGPAIDKFAKQHGKLPLGIIERERTKTITIKPIKDFVEAE